MTEHIAARLYLATNRAPGLEPHLAPWRPRLYAALREYIAPPEGDWRAETMAALDPSVESTDMGRHHSDTTRAGVLALSASRSVRVDCFEFPDRNDERYADADVDGGCWGWAMDVDEWDDSAEVPYQTVEPRLQTQIWALMEELHRSGDLVAFVLMAPLRTPSGETLRWTTPVHYGTYLRPDLIDPGVMQLTVPYGTPTPEWDDPVAGPAIREDLLLRAAVVCALGAHHYTYDARVQVHMPWWTRPVQTLPARLRVTAEGHPRADASSYPWANRVRGIWVAEGHVKSWDRDQMGDFLRRVQMVGCSEMREAGVAAAAAVDPVDSRDLVDLADLLRTCVRRLRTIGLCGAQADVMEVYAVAADLMALDRWQRQADFPPLPPQIAALLEPRLGKKYEPWGVSSSVLSMQSFEP